MRGLDYYTRTTFEFKDEAIGAKDTICGGGRYDGLIEAIGGPPTPGIGFGAGIERLLLSVGERDPPRDRRSTASSSSTRALTGRSVHRRRWRSSARAACACDTDYAGRSKKGQLTQASRLGAGTTVIVDADGARIVAARRRRTDERSSSSRLRSAHELARPPLRRAAARRTKAAPSRWPGWAARRRDHGGLVFIDLRDETGVTQLVVNPEHAPEAARRRARRAERVRAAGPRARSCAARPRPSTRRCRPAKSRSRSRSSTVLSTCRRCPFQLDEENVDEALRKKLPLARPAPRAHAAEHPRARAARPDHPRGDGARGLRRHRDADPLEADARGRARLPRAVAAAAGQVLRAAAVAADREAAARDLGLRALLPDRPLLPRRGSARRPPPGADSARRRDGLPRPRVHLRADGADRRFASGGECIGVELPAPVRAHDVRRGDAPLRDRPSRPALRASRSRRRPRTRAAPSSASSRTRRASATSPCREEFSRTELQALENQAKSWGAKGLAYVVFRADGEIGSPIAKFLVGRPARALARAGSHAALRRRRRPGIVAKVLGLLRLQLGRELELIDESRWKFLWIVDMPSAEYDEQNGTLDRGAPPVHAPDRRQHRDLQDRPGRARARSPTTSSATGSSSPAARSGSTSPSCSSRSSRTSASAPEEQREKFGFLLDALAMGAPPHGGIASGIDRLQMALLERAVHPRHAGVPQEPGRLRLHDRRADRARREEQLDELGLRVVVEADVK